MSCFLVEKISEHFSISWFFRQRRTWLELFTTKLLILLIRYLPVLPEIPLNFTKWGPKTSFSSREIVGFCQKNFPTSKWLFRKFSFFSNNFHKLLTLVDFQVSLFVGSYFPEIQGLHSNELMLFFARILSKSCSWKKSFKMLLRCDNFPRLTSFS